METAYFVSHPRIEKTAVVFAPSTETARTTFLDWLERNNFIRRGDRQAFRKNMATQRLEDPAVPADMELHYGYREYTSPARYPEGEVYEAPRPEPEPVERDEELDKLVEGVRREPEPEPEVEPEPVPRPEPEPPRGRGMPIQQVMLRGYVE